MGKMLVTRDNTGVPCVGLGTYPFQGEEMADMVLRAYSCGYRLFDTADDYRGETGLGMAVQRLRKDGVARDQLFIQTKISDNNAHADEPLIGVYFNPNNHFMQRHSAAEVVREKVSVSLRELGTDYLDSLLIHYPYPAYYVDIWNEMIQLKSEGLVRYIGVSNFHERHIERLIQATGVCPEINEIYISPIGTKVALVDYCLAHDCLPMTYSPLMDLAAHRLSLEVLEPIAKRYNRSTAQVVLRWNVQRGCMPIPKSSSPVRMKENFDVSDFELSMGEMQAISGLNCDYQYLVESKICPGM